MTVLGARVLARAAMWSIVPTGSVRHDSEELGTSFVIYPTASDGSAEVRTTPDASSLPAWAIWDQIAGWCREHHVTPPRWSVVRGGEPRAFAELVDALDGTLTDSTDVLVAPIDAALALPALVTATRAEVIRTRAQVVAGEAVSRRVWGSGGDDAGIEAKVAALATPVGTRAGFGVLARDPSGAVVCRGMHAGVRGCAAVGRLHAGNPPRPGRLRRRSAGAPGDGPHRGRDRCPGARPDGDLGADHGPQRLHLLRDIRQVRDPTEPGAQPGSRLSAPARRG